MLWTSNCPDETIHLAGEGDQRALCGNTMYAMNRLGALAHGEMTCPYKKWVPVCARLSHCCDETLIVGNLSRFLSNPVSCCSQGV